MSDVDSASYQVQWALYSVPLNCMYNRLHRLTFVMVYSLDLYSSKFVHASMLYSLNCLGILYAVSGCQTVLFVWYD